MPSVPRLVPIGVRPIAVLLVTAAYCAMLVRLPAPTQVAVSLQPAEVMILPPGDPHREIAAVGSPESAAAQASDGFETASAVQPAELRPVEELTAVTAAPEKVIEAVEAPESAVPLLQAAPIPDVVESAVTIAAAQIEQNDANELEPVTAAQPKREVVDTKEVKPKKPDPTPKKKQAAKPKSAASPARRGQAGSGGGQQNASGQSIAAYASHVRSVLVSRAQRIRGLRSTGQVGLTFTISANGHMDSLSLRSSGSAEIDRAVRSALAGVTFPPPPNGRFEGSITITVR